MRLFFACERLCRMQALTQNQISYQTHFHHGQVQMAPRVRFESESADDVRPSRKESLSTGDGSNVATVPSRELFCPPSFSSLLDHSGSFDETALGSMARFPTTGLLSSGRIEPLSSYTSGSGIRYCTTTHADQDRGVTITIYYIINDVD